MMAAALPLEREPAQRHDYPSSPRAEWRDDRLREARAVIADVAHHPVSLVLMACRVVEGHSEDRGERIGAHVLASLLQSGREGRP